MSGKQFMKLGIILGVVVLISFSDWSFAADDNMDALKKVAEMLDLMVSIMSWIWVFLAKGAGELLTNNRVYGEILGLDAILWKYRNLVKNFANFGLGLYFLYEVFKGLINSAEKIKDKLVWLLIAGVGIQSSWFLTAAVVDLSTITLATAGAFPATIVSDQEEVMESVSGKLDEFLKANDPEVTINNLKKRLNFSLFSPDMGASNFISIKSQKLEKEVKPEEIIDELLPNPESLSGPLYYLGFSILKTTKVPSPNSSNENGWMATIFNTILQGGTTIIYCLEMLVLFILAFMRVLYMWLFIVLSPIVVLLWCVAQSGGLGSLEKKLEGLTKHVNFSSFFWNAFKPTLIALGIGLSMIFVSMMSSMISGKSFGFDTKGMIVYDYPDGKPANGNDGDQKYTTVMDGDMMEISIKNVGKTTSDFILAIVTLILVYMIIKIAANMGSGSDFVSKTIKKVQGTVGEGIGSMPLIPVTGYDENGKYGETHFISVGSAFGRPTIGSPDGNKNLLESKISRWDSLVKGNVDAQTKNISDLFGWSDSGRMDAVSWGKIETAGKDDNLFGLTLLKAKRDAIPKTEKGWGFVLNPTKGDNRWRDSFKSWLQGTKSDEINNFSGVASEYIQTWKDMVERWKKEENKNKSLQNMFEDKLIGERAVKAYVNFFGLSQDIITWLDLQNQDISKSDEK